MEPPYVHRTTKKNFVGILGCIRGVCATHTHTICICLLKDGWRVVKREREGVRVENLCLINMGTRHIECTNHLNPGAT